MSLTHQGNMIDQPSEFVNRHSFVWALKHAVWAALFAATFVLITFLLHGLDLRNNNFDQSGLVYPLHHALVLLLGFYISWVFYAVGRTIASKLPVNLDSVILCSFLGVSIVQLLVVALGFAGCLYTWVMVAATSLVLIQSWPVLVSSLHDLISYVVSNTNKQRLWIEYLLISVLAIVLGYLFTSKVIYPTFDWDTIMHYSQYFTEVIRSHHLFPNNVWYHYFYSKGAGAFIYGILLGDQDTHKLITYIVLIYASMAIWSILRVFKMPTLTLTCLIAWLGIFVPNSNWYIFDKQHVMMSCLLIGLFWASMRYQDAARSEKHMITLLTLIMIVSLVLFVPTTSGLLITLYALIALFSIWQKNRAEALRYVVFCITAGMAAACLLAFNYVTSGMMEINPVAPFFRLANQHVISQWTSPYIIISLLEGFPTDLTSFSFQLKALGPRIGKLLHLSDFHWILPLKAMVLLFAIIFMTRSELFAVKDKREHKKLAAAVMLVLIVGILVSFSMNQPISAARLYIFTTPLVLMLLVSLIIVAMESVLYPSKHQLLIIFLAVFVSFSAIKSIRNQHTWRAGVLPFMTGAKNYKDAYQLKNYYSEDALIARRLVGLDERIITSNPMHQSYAIPGRPMEVELNYSYRDWHTMVFADPVSAKNAYDREGIHYFYFDFTYPINMMVPFSPLFRTDSILTNLRVVWHSKTAYLLTWRDTTDRSDKTQGRMVELEFAQKLAKADKTNVYGKTLYERIRLYWTRNNGAAFPVTRDTSLPDVRTVTRAIEAEKSLKKKKLAALKLKVDA